MKHRGLLSEGEQQRSLLVFASMLSRRTVREALAGLGLILLCGSVATHWHDLPPRVPVHFGLTGHPDGFGSKIILLILPATAIVLYLALTVVARYPAYFNFPVPGHRLQPANSARSSRRPAWVAQSGVIWIFAWLNDCDGLGEIPLVNRPGLNRPRDPI